MKYCINIKQSKAKQSKAKQSKAKQSKAKQELRILISNSFKTFLIALLSFILLFSISCKPKQNPEEPYNGLIPKEYSGKYICPKGDGSYDYSDYYETTSSNTIIGYGERSNGAKGLIPIIFEKNVSYNYALGGTAIRYHEDTDSSGGRYTYIFYTNQSDLKRTLTTSFTTSTGWSYTFYHEDDIK